MSVSDLIAQAFATATQEHLGIHRSWIILSSRWGGRLPQSRLRSTIQNHGRLDMLLRSMESENASNLHSFAPGSINELVYLSESWIISTYETIRIIHERTSLFPDNTDLNNLKTDFDLLRMPLAKHEIPSDTKLRSPLTMKTHKRRGLKRTVYIYPSYDKAKRESKDWQSRAHIMPSATSVRGSIMWKATDWKTGTSPWIERQSLSDRILAFAHDSKPAIST